MTALPPAGNAPAAHPTEPHPPAAAAEPVDCWNRVGVAGDGSCGRLPQYVHCRNCPVYAQAGAELLQRPVPRDYQHEWSAHLAQPKRCLRPVNLSVVVFRLGGEWLALDTRVFHEVAERRPVHSLPHRRQGAVLGLVNVRGELVLCVSLERLLDLPDAPPPETRRREHHRLLVLESGERRLAVPVDEVAGLHRCNRAELHEPPATVRQSARAVSGGWFTWQGRPVGYLRWEALLANLNRDLA